MLPLHFDGNNGGQTATRGNETLDRPSIGAVSRVLARTMKSLGIDPGVTGAVAVFDGATLVACFDIPTIKPGKRTRVNAGALAGMLREHMPISHAYIERVGSRPGEGAVGAFSFGHTAGTIEGVVAALGIPVTLVTPASWKPAAGLNGSDKARSRARASQLFPRHAALFARVKDDGRAEAALIGWIGRTRDGVARGAIEW